MDILIIGSGPAGISAALYAKRAGADVTVISRGSGALAKAERIENYYGLAEPVIGAELEANGIAGAKRLGVKFVEGEVVGLTMNDDFTGLVVQTAKEKFEAGAVILAAGSTRLAPKIPGLKEMEGKGVSYCAICDAFFYRGKVAAVLGEGEYALHEAEILLPHASKVMLFTNGKEPTVAIPDSIEVHKEKVSAVEAATENGTERVSGVMTEDGTLTPVNGLFVALGTAGSVDLARKIGAAVDNNRIVTDAEMATNVPGLYAAGDCNGGLLQVVKAAYEGAVAGLAAAKYVRKR
ncbi:MAG: NAD(P)/FAD-dependent oxidoreductase [Succiniclasticum sp.]|uniref:NAD(P)/FAD-dependent oxidoreductase n=1 Tax=Succiniclasticum sp. TaxID=2775030 RepID=UPI002A9207CA|nr:NAD(P)/FAD-dependent oxidoreductase [Succiniclasticum sp.]MDY6290948.1 NAD(P)/FAD-dependent oxidoreductase [Succiniclasticum sp.]